MKAVARVLHELEGSSDPMWIFDQQTLQILEVNDAAVLQYGYSRSEFLSLTVLDIRPPENIPEFLRSAFHHPHSSPLASVWRHQAKNGEIFWVSITSRQISFMDRRAELVQATLCEESHATSDQGARVSM